MRKVDVGVDTITYLAFSPDGSTLAAAGHKGIGLGPWPVLADGRGTFNVGSSVEKVTQVAWHPDGYRFATASLDGAVQILNTRLRLRRELVELTGQQGHMLAVAFSPDGDRLALGGGWWDAPGSAVVVQSGTWQPIVQLEAHANQIGAIVFAGSDVIVTGSADKTVVLHTLTNPPEDTTVAVFPSSIQALAMAANGERLAVAAGNSIYLLRFDPPARSLLDERLACRGHKRVVRAISFSPDGRLLASVGEDGTLRFWDAITGAAKSAIDLGLGMLRAVAFAPDGLTAAAGGDAGTIAILDVDD